MTDWNPEPYRQAMAAFMQARGLKAAPWAEAAGLDKATVRHFLSGDNESLSLSTLAKLATAAQASIAELIGEGQATQPHENGAINVRVLAGVIEALEGWLTGQRLQLAAQDKAEAIALLYPFFASHPDEPVKITHAHQNVLRVVVGGRR